MDLVREYATSGSEAAFATLVRRHVNLVYSAALRRLGNPAEAEEVAQIVFTILARKAGTLRHGTVLSGWLYQTAQLTAANHQRAVVRRQYREQEAFMQFTEQSETDVSWHRLSPVLEEAMARLGQKDRDAIVLRFFENRTVGEVAAALGLHEDAAQKRVNRATNRLRNYFLRRGIKVSSAVLVALIGTNAVQAAPMELASKIAGGAALHGVFGTASTLTLNTTLKIMAWTKAKTAMVAAVGVLLAAGTTGITVKQIATHRLDDSWRVANPNPDRAPQMVKILPTKFPATVDVMNVGGRGDNWVAVGEPVLQIARVAYAWRPGRIIFPGGQPEGRYDFISTLPQNSGTVLQRELKNKLHYTGHLEMKDVNVLVLRVARPNASGLRPPITGRRDFIHGGLYHCDNAPISSDAGWYPGITRFLEDYFELPVIDQTGLTQNFNIDLRWEERFDRDPAHDALKKALLDQLGFELTPTNMPVQMLVMEKVK